MVEIELPNPEELRGKKPQFIRKKVALFTGNLCCYSRHNLPHWAAIIHEEHAARATGGSNQWAFYQAKNNREYMYRIEKEPAGDTVSGAR